MPITQTPSSPSSQSSCIAIRDHVPFDMWYHDHFILHTTSPCSARFGAVFALGKGLLNSSIEAIQYLFAKIFKAEARSDNLNVQCNSVCLCATALISPATAKEKAIREKFFVYWVNPPHLWPSRLRA